MQNIRSDFNKIIEAVKGILKAEINEKGNYKRPRTVPKSSDIEVIALTFGKLTPPTGR